MGLRDEIDRVNAAPSATEAVRDAYPDERIALSTAATALWSRREGPTAWSSGRFFQKRGNVTFTDRRIVFQTNARSPLAYLFAALILWNLYEWWTAGGTYPLILATVFGLLLIQRWPRKDDIAFEEIESIETSTVRGVSGTFDLLAVRHDGRTLNLCPAQRLRDEFLAWLRIEVGRGENVSAGSTR